MIYSFQASVSAVYVVMCTAPCVLLVLLTLAGLAIRRRSQLSRHRHDSKTYAIVPAAAGAELEAADTSLLTALTSTATLRSSLLPGLSLPNITKYELAREAGAAPGRGQSARSVSRSSLSVASSPDRRSEEPGAEAGRKRWQSDGAELEAGEDAALSPGSRWRSEDWEKDQSFMVMLARRLEVVDSKAEITEL